MEELIISATLQINQPVDRVYHAIIDPAEMSNYFISESSGLMEEGKTVEWKFPEFDMRFPVQVLTIHLNKQISFSWEDEEGGSTRVDIRLEAPDEKYTIVRVTEGSKEANDKGILWLKRNTEGWANFLACLKAWLEHGINLRKGGFDYMKKKAMSQA